MKDPNCRNDFEELQALLKEKADVTPPCDLDSGFIKDLHVKLRSESLQQSSLSLLGERVQERLSSLLNPTLAWGGASFATIALALSLGYFLNKEQATENEIASQNVSIDSQYIVEVKAQEGIDFEGTLPAFSNLEQDF